MQVSVMDVDDLNARGMDTAISQELEISMLCSSLITLNICPNLVLVSSVFQSEYPPPDFLWRSKSRVPPLLMGLGEDFIFIRCYFHFHFYLFLTSLFVMLFLLLIFIYFINLFIYLFIYSFVHILICVDIYFFIISYVYVYLLCLSCHSNDRRGWHEI